MVRQPSVLCCSSPDLPNPVSAAVHLNIHAGIDLSSLTLQDYSSGRNTIKYQYGSKNGFRVGAEAELVLPVNRNKWSILLGSDYRTYSTGLNDSAYHVSYKAMQLSIGGRNYMFIGPKSKIFLTAAITANFPFGKSLSYDGYNFMTDARYSEGFGAGFQYQDRLGIEVKYWLPQQILDNYPLVSTQLKTISMTLSYRML